MINWKNVIITTFIFAIGAVVGAFISLYSSNSTISKLEPVLSKETQKIEQTIATTIDNKFKKVGEVHSANTPNVNPTATAYQVTTIGKDSVCLPISNLTRRQKRRLGLK